MLIEKLHTFEISLNSAQTKTRIRKSKTKETTLMIVKFNVNVSFFIKSVKDIFHFDFFQIRTLPEFV